MRTRSASSAVAVAGLVFTSLCLAVSTAPALAQDKAADTGAVANRRVTIALDDADIRSALKVLFSKIGANYGLDPTVQGTVTVSLTDTPFGVALDTILKSAGSAVPLAYRVENNVWMVAPKPEAKQPQLTAERATTEGPTAPRTRYVKIHLNFADAYDIAAALGGGYIQTRFSQMLGGGGGFRGYGGSTGVALDNTLILGFGGSR